MEKSRYWAFILYPESAIENWKDVLQETGLKIAISPLHDSDENPDHTKKKSHYHIMMIWETGTTTYNIAKKVCDLVGGTIPKRVMSVVGMYRYFTHTDNPEKYQYSEKDIICLNGFDISDINPMTSSQKIAIKRQLQRIIIERHILEYSDLMDYLLEIDETDFYEVASNQTLFFDRYISSRRNKIKDSLQELSRML